MKSTFANRADKPKIKKRRKTLFIGYIPFDWVTSPCDLLGEHRESDNKYKILNPPY